MKTGVDKSGGAARSAIMRAVKSKHTRPELHVRRLAHAMGYRFRLHRKDFPGTPDLVFPARRKVIFVHGCFWHGHACARGARTPKTNADYWRTKILRNKERDAVNCARLREMNWSVLMIWECELRVTSDLETRLRAFLDERKLNTERKL